MQDAVACHLFSMAKKKGFSFFLCKFASINHFSVRMMTFEFILRIFVAAVLGGLIGLEREYREKAAGLRTHFLVALGSALFMIISAYGFEGVLKDPNMRLDVSRIAAQVVSPVLVNDKNTRLYHIDFSFDEQRLGGFNDDFEKVLNDFAPVPNIFTSGIPLTYSVVAELI